MTNRREEIKRENQKSLKKFLVIILIAGIIGGCIGAYGWRAEGTLTELTISLMEKAQNYTLYILIAVTILFQSVCWILYRKSKKLYLEWDGEDEELPNKIEVKMGYAMWGTTLNMIFAFLCFAIGLCKSAFEEINLRIVFYILTVFVINIILIVLVQQKMVDLLKEMNPEKRGSVYDMRFSAKWIESSDEAERMQIYQAAWASYKVMNYVYAFAWLVTFLANDFLGIGISACVAVTILWAIQSSAYCYKSIQLIK